MKSKSNEETLENHKNKRRNESTSRPKINDDDIIHKIKINPLTFDGIIDPKDFSDWMAELNYYFDWYRYNEKSRIRFARMRLTGSVRIY